MLLLWSRLAGGNAAQIDARKWTITIEVRRIKGKFRETIGNCQSLFTTAKTDKAVVAQSLGGGARRRRGNHKRLGRSRK